jgi:hypothetical protein
MVKQESHFCRRSACSPFRSVTSSTVVQKQVGQTMVQLPHVKQAPRHCPSEGARSYDKAAP